MTLTFLADTHKEEMLYLQGTQLDFMTINSVMKKVVYIH